VSAGAGWEVQRRHYRNKLAARHAGYRGMDDMHPPRAAISRVNALGDTPPYDGVSQHP
jgi:hypothetical protein